MAVVDRMIGTVWTSYRAQQYKTEIVRRFVERIEVDEREMKVTFRTGVTVFAAAAGRLGQ